ncbi:MAG TPA: SDR family oxidoreductase [Solirubrobacteraceae bacterium]|jgi:NAD(P)-dependent dehydrogenase (short-subunit alcohol dehydrogenase family)|nr:SDR family oxidoreductase [Solirubrobacteraceae bacterium]
MLLDNTALVVGASRGLGRGIATSLAAAGADVVALARSEASLAELSHAPGVIRTESADAAEPAVAGSLIDRYEPRLLVLVAGAAPPVLPLLEQTWQTLSVNWHADVRIAFNWLQAALRKPLAPGSRVVLFSSGAALQGSPLSGGYAGAKATQRFLAAYAQEEANRIGLEINITVLMPRLTPLTELGRPAVTAYAERQGKSEAEYLQQFGEPLSPQGAGAAVLELASAPPDSLAAVYLLTGDGLKPLT